MYIYICCCVCVRVCVCIYIYNKHICYITSQKWDGEVKPVITFTFGVSEEIHKYSHFSTYWKLAP
jgi:hypothetical protein